MNDTNTQMPSTDDRPVMISVDDVTLAFGSKVIQHDVSFRVKRGSIFAVMGGSGCGKSTLLKSMIGLLRPTHGTYLVERTITGLAMMPAACGSAGVSASCSRAARCGVP